MRTTTETCLELRHEGSSGYRHYLDGRAAHAGSLLEALTRGGWVLGRYEWSFRSDRRPYLITNSETSELIVLNDDTVLRWPQ